MAEGYASPVDPKLTQEANDILADSRTEKAQFITDFTEAWQYCFPQRVKPNTSTSTPGTRSNSAAQNFMSLGESVITDFATQISYSFAPEHTPFAGEKITSAIPEELQEDARALVDADTNTIFDAINASNFHEAFKQGAKDLGVSAFGMFIQDPGRGQPIRCQAIPLTELLIWRGPDGTIDGRFWEQTVKVRKLEALFPGIPLPKKITDKREKGKNTTCKKTQGCWRDYSTPGVIAWHCITLLDDEAIEYSHYDGAGSAPLLVCRWDADSPFAWGNGPAIKALPDFRALDEYEYLGMKSGARRVDPPVAYKDDGDMNLDGGLANGVLIPCLDEPSFQVIESSNPNSMAELESKVSKIEHTIRRHFYVDEPQQEGLTPPTLGQWLDESMRTQRRLGTPAATIWSEFLSEGFMHFRYMLVKSGQLNPLQIGGKAVILRAFNPLQRAAEMEEAAASLRTLQSLEATFPGMAPMFFDIGKTVHKIVAQSRATGLVLKKEQEINDALANQQKMAQIGNAATAVGQSGVLPLLAATQKGVTPA